MTPAWSLVELAARPLSREEQDAILGDSIEAGESAWQALRGVLGLILRRQLLLWRGWRPWCAAFAFALPCTLLLAYVSVSVTCTSERLFGCKLRGWAPTGHEGFVLLFCHIFLLITWAWTSGFAVGSISPRTLWSSTAVGLVVISRFGMHMHSQAFPLYYSLLFVAPAIWGVLQGTRNRSMTVGTALLLAASMTLLTTAAWVNNALWIFNWLLLGPALFLLGTARRPARAGDTSGT